MNRIPPETRNRSLLKISTSAKLRRRNDGLGLIGVGAFFVSRTDRGRNVVIGLSIGDGSVRIESACVQNRIDSRIGSTRLAATINVVADRILRRTRSPRQIDGVLRRGCANARQAFNRGRVRSVADNCQISAAASGRYRRKGDVKGLFLASR